MVGRRFFVTLKAALIMCDLLGCAANLPRSKDGKNVKVVDGVAIDVGLLVFRDVESGEEINVAHYMDRNNLNYLALMFGSVGCVKCNEKAQDLSRNYLSRHNLFLNKAEHQFDLIGVNTDSGGAALRFRTTMLNAEERARKGYDFIRWTDESANTLRTHLLPKGETFGVPFVVLLSRSSIVWRINNKVHYSVADLIERIEASLAGRELPSVSSAIPTMPKPDQRIKSLALLAYANKERLSEIDAKRCDGDRADLRGVLARSDFTIVHASKQACGEGSVCRKNFKFLNDFMNVCNGGSEPAHPCQVLHFAVKPISYDMCEQDADLSLLGGGEFFEAFASHFNWSYEPNVNQWNMPISLPEVAGPLVLVFNRKGDLIYSAEGALDEIEPANSIQRALHDPESFSLKRIAHPVLTSQENKFQTKPLHELLNAAEYTVINSFDRYCDSCIDELITWESKGGLAEFCRKSTGFCQIYALEAELAVPNDASRQRVLYQEIMQNYFAPRKIGIPLLIDTTSVGDGYARLFGGYFTPMFPHWDGVYGSVVYDREGKIVAEFKSVIEQHSPEHDPILKFLRSLRP